jgi:small-conductance mechanosensitive channel
MDFGIRAWSHQYGDWVNVRSDLNLRLHEALKVAGIDIPFPQQDLHLRSISAQVSAALVRPPEIPAR